MIWNQRVENWAIRSAVLSRSLAHSLAPEIMGKRFMTMNWMRRFHIILTRSALVLWIAGFPGAVNALLCVFKEWNALVPWVSLKQILTVVIPFINLLPSQWWLWHHCGGNEVTFSRKDLIDNVPWCVTCRLCFGDHRSISASNLNFLSAQTRPSE